MLSSTLTRISQLGPRETPDAALIIEEIRAALDNAKAMGVFDKVVRCHELRRCIWPNQAQDGLKHGEKAFPYDRAVDAKARIAEPIINDNVRIRMAATRSGNVVIGPQNEVEDSGKSQLWDSVLRHYRNGQKRSITQNLKLFFTCVEEFGYGIAKVDWRDTQQLIPQDVTADDLASFLAQSTIAARQQSAEIEGIPLEDDQLGLLQEEASMNAAMAVQQARVTKDVDSLAGWLLQLDPTIDPKEAKVAARELSRKGEATYYAPRSTGGSPILKALIPWVNIVHGIELNDSETSTWMAEPEWIDSTELLIRAKNWDVTQEDLKTIQGQPNRGLSEMLDQELKNTWLLNGVGIGYKVEQQNNLSNPLFQVITVTRVAVSDTGIPAVFETVIHPFLPTKVLSNKVKRCLNMPFVVEQREPATLAVQSRGVPELVDTEQVATKKLLDGSVAAGELAAFPPVVQGGKDSTQPKPGARFFEGNRQSGSAGVQTRFLPVPGVDAGAVNMMKLIKEGVDTLFHRGPQSDPDARRLYNDDLGTAAVQTLEEIVKLFWSHIQVYVGTITASRIAGRPVSVEASQEDLMGTADVNVEFSSLSLNQEAALKMLDTLTKARSLDATGRMDLGAGVEMVLRTFDVALAEKVVLPGDVAAQRIMDEEQRDLAVLTSGSLAPVRQGSEQVRLKVIEDWLANPINQQKLQVDQVLSDRLQQRIQAFQFAVTQQQNAVIGATGYDPNKDPVLGPQKMM